MSMVAVWHTVYAIQGLGGLGTPHLYPKPTGSPTGAVDYPNKVPTELAFASSSYTLM